MKGSLRPYRQHGRHFVGLIRYASTLLKKFPLSQRQSFREIGLAWLFPRQTPPCPFGEFLPIDLVLRQDWVPFHKPILTGIGRPFYHTERVEPKQQVPFSCLTS